MESAGSTWTPATAEVAEALLIGTTATVEAVRTATGLSHGATVTALGRLEREGLVRRPGPSKGPRSGRQVVDRDQLLREFASAAARVAQKQPTLLLHRIWKDQIQALSSEMAGALNLEGIRWAVTGPVASTLLAPYLTEVTILDLYVDDEAFANADRLAAVLGARLVDRGHRIEVRRKPTRLDIFGARDGRSAGCHSCQGFRRSRGKRRPVGGSCLSTLRRALLINEPRNREAREPAEIALVRWVHAYGTIPEVVLLGGLVPDLVCSKAALAHVGTTDIDVQVDLEIAGGSGNAKRIEEALKAAGFVPDPGNSCIR